MLEGLAFDNITRSQAIIKACEYMEQERSHDPTGWRFYSGGTLGTFPRALEKSVKRCNSGVGVTWALKMTGIIPETSDTLNNYKGKLGTTQALEHVYRGCYYINCGATVESAMSGALQPGDIAVYQDMYHINIYLGNQTWFDTGQTYCKGKGEGTVYERWIGGTKYPKEIIKCILRPKPVQNKIVPKQPKVENTIPLRKFWVGDSRFVGMKGMAKKNDVFICKSSMGYDWLTSTALTKLKQQLNNTKGEVVILGLGVNDLHNISKYVSTYKSLINSYKNTKFMVVSVNPCYDPKSNFITCFTFDN